MPSLPAAALLGCFAAAFFACVGLPVALRVMPRALALAVAPALGWAIYSAAAFPIHCAVGLSRETALAVAGIALLVAIYFLFAARTAGEPDTASRVPVWAFVLAALLALAPAAAVVPKIAADGIALASPIFDHSKVAMIDEMARLGVPSGNPFFAEVGGVSRLPYYYLWHFSAALLSLATGSSGWSADAALTWFTAFASLSVVMGLAVWISGRSSASLWAVALAATASARPVAELLFGVERTAGWMGWPGGFGGWLFQVSWAPQHVASATCAVLAALAITQLARQREPLVAVVLGMLVAAAFQSSTWIGGVAFPFAAAAIGIVALKAITPEQRAVFAVRAVLAASIALALSALFIHDQLVMTALRGETTVKLMPFAVLGEAFPPAARTWLDPPAYWLLILPFEFPAFYPAGLAALVFFLRSSTAPKEMRLPVAALACLVAVSLCVAWLFVSALGENNDLGWRAVLPAVLLLVAFAAAGFARAAARPIRTFAVVAGLAGLALGLPHGLAIAYSNAVVTSQTPTPVFAASAAMWQAVRQQTGPAERIANNPDFLRAMTPWPVNISWALLANRRSCYAARELVQPFVPLTPQRRSEIDALFRRAFADGASSDDLRSLATDFDCRAVVLTAQDGAWQRDPFAANPLYRLVDEKPGAYRIYRVDTPAR